MIRVPSVGSVFGLLTVVEGGEHRCLCECQCGKKDIWRDTAGLYASKRSAQVPMCKGCKNAARKRGGVRMFVKWLEARDARKAEAC